MKIILLTCSTCQNKSNRINFIYFKFGHINIWPSREVIDRTMPEAFKNKYGSTRVIID